MLSPSSVKRLDHEDEGTTILAKAWNHPTTGHGYSTRPESLATPL
jgi:hypothetical protein